MIIRKMNWPIYQILFFGGEIVNIQQGEQILKFHKGK